MRYRQVSLIFVVLVAIARHGAAVSALSVHANGSCPTGRELEAALVERGLELGVADYTVDVQSEATGATLRLRRSGQGQVLERHFASQDCRAMAEAIAVVVEAYFIEMHGPDVAPTHSTAGNDRDQTGAAPDSAPNPALAPKPTLQSDPLSSPNSALPPPIAPPSQTGTMAPLRPLNARGEPGSAGKPRPPLLFEGFVGVGPTLTLPSATLTPGIEIGAGADVPSVPISTELALATTWPTISGSGLDRVQRWGSQGALRVGLPLVGALRYRPWLGVGLSAARLHALEVPAAPTKITMTSIVEAGLELAWPVSTTWHGRFDIGCSVLMFRDTYQVDPDGEIGRGPRVVCATLIGVGIGDASAGRDHR